MSRDSLLDPAETGAKTSAEKKRARARELLPEDLENPTPVYCVWELTLACDLGCKHCGSRAGKAREGELSTEECLAVVEELDALGVREVTLIGGEAYLREDWDIIAKEMADRGMRVGIGTGARNLTDERIARAEAAGVDAISISIDGLETTHDRLRGPKGSWAAAVDAARRVGESKVNLQANSQINRLSMPELPAMADLLVDLGVNAWQIQLTVPMGRAADREGLLLQPYDLLELFPLLVWIKQTKLDPANLALFPSNNVGYFSLFEELLRFNGDRGAHWSGCGAGKWGLGLEADGKIKGCPSLPSAPYTGGYLGKDVLAEVVANAPELVQTHRRTRDDLWGYCKECYYGDVCKGGCTWMAHTLLGKPGNNPYCIHRALHFEKQGLRERVVRREQADGDPFDFARFEIELEPFPQGSPEEVPSILGLALGEISTLDFNQKSIWSKDQLDEYLTRR